MPKLVDTTANNMRAFIHHCVELNEHGQQHNGTCPFCTKDKFTVQTETGVWRCWVCGRTGNPLEFIRQLWAASDKATDDGWLKKFAVERTLLDRSTLQQWGVCMSIIDGVWMLPGYNVRGELVQLYRRVQMEGSDDEWSYRLLPTPGIWPEGKAHGLHMPSMSFDPARSIWWFCEGPWDGMAFWEVARQSKRLDSGVLELTSNIDASLLADANVLAVPGCNVWQDVWSEACRGKDVMLPFDNDHPRDNAGTITMPGYDGVKRIAGKLGGIARSVSFVQWGAGGYDVSLATGFDVRDALAKGM